jgi:hypothetical protein
MQLNPITMRFVLDQAAILHNRGLDQILSLPNFADLTMKKKFMLAKEKVHQYYPMVNVSSVISYERFDQFYQQIIQLEECGKHNEFPDYLQSQGHIDASQKEKLRIVYDVLHQARESNSFEDVDSPLRGIEASMLLQTDSSYNDSLLMLSATRIASHTSRYWMDSQLNPDSPGHLAARKGWFGRALRDLGGFVVGALVGNAIAGPPGAVAGGTLVGKAASS